MSKLQLPGPHVSTTTWLLPTKVGTLNTLDELKLLTLVD